VKSVLVICSYEFKGYYDLVIKFSEHMGLVSGLVISHMLGQAREYQVLKTRFVAANVLNQVPCLLVVVLNGIVAFSFGSWWSLRLRFVDRILLD
jgi:hypothetical protein